MHRATKALKVIPEEPGSWTTP